MRTNPSSSASGILALFAVLVGLGLPAFLEAQSPRRPTPRPQAPARRPTPAPAPAPTAPPAPATPVVLVPPPPPPPQDLRLRTVYTTEGQRTESVTFYKGSRQRHELGPMVVIRQGDLSRTIQVSTAAQTFFVVADVQASGPAAAASAAAALPPGPSGGVVTMTTSVVDTGERKTVFGRQARRVRTTLDKQPSPGACDNSRDHIETDGWYIDLPAAPQPLPASPPPPTCRDTVRSTQTGDVTTLGFPVSYTMTVTSAEGAPSVVSMEVSELELTTLADALFELPAGYTEAPTIDAMSRALSDAREAELLEASAGPRATPTPRTPGALRVAVPQVVNKTPHAVDVRALRASLVAALAEAKIDAAAFAAPEASLVTRAAEQGHDFVLMAEVTELKASKGGIGGLLKAASQVAGGQQKTATEAALGIKLVQPDGKTRYSATVKGKDGGFDLKSGLNVARFAGSMYMNAMTGRMMMRGFGPMAELQGLGALGNPALFQMQSSGLGLGMAAGSGGGVLRGLDLTAGAASFLMNQTAAMQGPMATLSAPGQPDVLFDAALNEAFENVAKSVAEQLRKGAQAGKR